MVPDMTQKRSVMLFIEGLQDKLKGLVRAFQPATLKDAIDVTLRLDTTPTPYQTNLIKLIRNHREYTGTTETSFTG